MFGDLAYCTVFESGAYYSCDTVPDDHRHGESLDGRWRHVEGIHLPDGETVAFGLCRGRWLPDGRTENYPVGHGPAVAEAVLRPSPARVPPEIVYSIRAYLSPSVTGPGPLYPVWPAPSRVTGVSRPRVRALPSPAV